MHMYIERVTWEANLKTFNIMDILLGKEGKENVLSSEAEGVGLLLKALCTGCERRSEVRVYIFFVTIST